MRLTNHRSEQGGRPWQGERSKLGETRWDFGGPACINEVMSSVETARFEARRLATWRTRPRRSQPVLRAPWKRGSWSPEEVAHALNARRKEFCRALDRRRDAFGVPAGMREEIVDEAICAVVMSRRAIVSEEHLLGAFWTAVGLVLKEHHAGRRLLRVGSRERVDFELIAARIPTGGEPFDVVELREQMARAADFMAALSAFERRVVVVMAVSSGGVKLAARTLGVPIKTVRAAARSADEKLDQVAVIAAAGRMCSYRYPAIVAEASGLANEDQAQAARAHVEACRSCRRLYVGLCREMRERKWQRRAAAAVLPAPMLNVGGHGGGLGRLAAFIANRPVGGSGGNAERVAGVLGGGGIAKAAAAGTAIVVAGGALTGHIVHAIAGAQAPAHHRRAHVVRQSYQPVNLASGWANLTSSLAARSSSPSTQSSRTSTTARPSLPTPPSKSLGYLALGTPGSASHSGSASHDSSPEPSARVASVASPATKSEGAPPPTQSGGGTSLGYLGR
jgi:DNA-directed RNA polymerase specialized sigma24 family protein